MTFDRGLAALLYSFAELGGSFFLVFDLRLRVNGLRHGVGQSVHSADCIIRVKGTLMGLDVGTAVYDCDFPLCWTAFCSLGSVDSSSRLSKQRRYT